MSVYMFDPCLGVMTGHWENFCRRFHDTFVQRGVECRIFCQAETSAEIVSGMAVIPTFTRSPFIDANDPVSFAEECEFFARDFAGIDTSCFRKGDLLIFPTIFPQILKPLMAWLENLTQLVDVEVLILFQFAGGVEKDHVPFFRRLVQRGRSLRDAAADPARKLPRGLTWAYSPMIANYLTMKADIKRTRKNPHYRYFAASKELAHNFGKLFDLSVTAMPMPAPAVNLEALQPEAAQSEIVRVGYFGHASLEKGAQFLEPVIDKVLRSRSNVEFSLHVNANKDTVQILAPFKHPRERTHCVHGHITQEDMLEMMKGVDIVLMPYNAAKYRTTPSAIFTECMSWGKVTVIPDNTWICNEAKAVQTGCVVFRDYNAESIATALLQAIDRFPALQMQAHEAAKRFRKRHGIDRCVDMILRQAA